MKTKIIIALGFLLYNVAVQASDTSCSYTMEEDTTIYTDARFITSTATLENAPDYFAKNNKYKDWDKNDPKSVWIKGIVEKDGSITNARVVKSSKIDKLDAEAIRLIKSVKITPGTVDWKVARTEFYIVVPFPSVTDKKVKK
jgi:TonB family protein